ncbi:hypothetical protein RIF29_24364 [Crotalaria pallida]|uniref:Uncharacterized protein n=1 Tax=Crotalaria pallida TaxID=3830 RepID=A0AAN9EK99_CROPI
MHVKNFYIVNSPSILSKVNTILAPCVPARWFSKQAVTHSRSPSLPLRRSRPSMSLRRWPLQERSNKSKSISISEHGHNKSRSRSHLVQVCP